MPPSELDKLVRKGGALKAKLTAAQTYLSEAKDRYNVQDVSSKAAIKIEVKLRLTKLEPVFEQFESIQNDIDNLAEDFDNQLSERTAFENYYYRSVAPHPANSHTKRGQCF